MLREHHYTNGQSSNIQTVGRTIVPIKYDAFDTLDIINVNIVKLIIYSEGEYV